MGKLIGRYDPVNVTEKKSHLIKTPGIEKLRHSFIVRMLVQERVRCIMDDVTFGDSALTDIVRKFLTIPAFYDTPEKVNEYINSEYLEIVAAFNEYEKLPVYQEDLRILQPYRGHVWRLHSATASGVLIVIEV